MPSLFGYSDYLAYGLLAVLGVVLLVLAFLAWRNPVIFKLGLRNIPRRPAQSILIIVGLTLSTIIIVASFSTGDTLNNSVRRQAVAAYGEIDEIVAPPLISMFTTLGAANRGNTGLGDAATSEEAQQQQDELNNLFSGGLTSVLTVLQGGLPGISTDRLGQLKQEASADAEIDGVAGSILFPTIIRNTTSGRGVPIGFIFAVDDDFDQTFGLTNVDGRAMEIESLQPGVGNVFAKAASLIGVLGEFGQRMGINLSVPNIVTAVGVISAVLPANGGDLSQLKLDLPTLRKMGIDTKPLEDAGITVIDVGEILRAVPQLAATLGLTDTATLETPDASRSASTVAPSVPTTATNASPADAAPAITESLPALAATPLAQTATTTSTVSLSLLQRVQQTGQDAINSFNLNTLGRDLDAALANVGLQVRQGDIYLNRVGAEALNAETGDVLEVFIGPVPVPFRVRAIVDQASPVGALLPVVVMRLDEGQNLLFMQDKVNNVLISNQGDDLSGVAHTDAVSARLRELAMDPEALDEVAALLRRDDVKAVIAADAGKIDEEMDFGRMPKFMATLFENMSGLADLRRNVQAMAAALDEDGMTPALRTALASTEVRSWLLQRDLPSDVTQQLTDHLSQLNQFDVLDPLSKRTVLLASDVAGGIFSSLFTVFGFFSVVAGIILIFLIFVMLAAERRSEMGTARAVGVRRSHLVQMFVGEGMVYSLVAAALGVVIGLAVSWAMVEYMGVIVNSVAGQLDSPTGGVLDFAFHVSWRSIVVAYCLGVLITFAVVTVSAWRVSRLNIVAAIRDLPDESYARKRSFAGKIARWVWPLALTTVGALVIVWGLRNALWSVTLIGATIALFGILYLVGRVLEFTRLRESTIHRIVYSLIGLGLLLLWIAPWQVLLPRVGLSALASDPTQILATFAIGGPMIITGAIMVIMFNVTVFTRLIELLFGWVGALTPVLKTAIAYPLSKRFRTGTAMVLFAMIMATVIVMGLVIQATQSLITMDDRHSGGFDIKVSSGLLSFFDPLTNIEDEVAKARADYPLLAEIQSVGAATSRGVQAQQVGSGAPGEVELLGLSPGFISTSAPIYPFSRRAEGFADDAAVWDALRTRDDVVVVRDGLLQDAEDTGNPPPFAAPGGQAGEDGPPIDEMRARYLRPFTITGVPSDGPLPKIMVDLSGEGDDGSVKVRTVQVIGVLSPGAMLQEEEMQGSLALLDSLLQKPSAPDENYVAVREGSDVRAVADELSRAFLQHGVSASVMADGFAQSQALTRNILRLLQGFMALGLLVGIAGLGVITTRTVVERRQQVGMLRAIGFQARTVSLSFLLESTFIAVTGLLIGAATGLVLGLNMVSVAFGGLEGYHIPWLSIGFVLLLAYAFSLLTTIIPAWQASHIYPAEALRYE